MIMDELMFLDLDQMIAVARVRLRRKIAQRLQEQGISSFGLVARDKHLGELAFISAMLKKTEGMYK
jgi:hypothetical protein